MKIEPGRVSEVVQTSQNSSSRERALNTLLNQSAPPAVQNQNNISPEEAGAIGAQKEQKSLSESQPSAEVPQAAPETKSEEPLSPQFAALARKEKALRAQAQKLAAERAAFMAEQEKIKVQPAQQQLDVSKYVERDRLVNDPINALLELGLSYDDITQRMLNPPPQQDPQTLALIQKMEAKIAELEGKTEKVQKTYEESQTQQYQQAINQLKSETKQLVTSDNRFELISATDSVDDVVDLIERTFKSEGRILSVEEAAQEIEDYLAEEATRLAKLSKIKSRIMPAQPAKAEDASSQKLEQKPTSQSGGAKTLSNSMGTNRTLSVRERAVLAFEGKLGK